MRMRAGIAPILSGIFQPHRYKGIFGGRASSKSYGLATLIVLYCIMYPGLRVLCIREIQKSLEQSSKHQIEDRIRYYGVESQFRILNTHIETPGGGIILFQGMQNHTADTIKSFADIDIAWVEEAQSLSAHSLKLLRPTIRGTRIPGSSSEIWFSWNPSQPTDPVDDFFRGQSEKSKTDGWLRPPDALIVEANWEHNPWFTDVMRLEMEHDRARDTDMYDHVWGGGYETKSEARVFKNWRIDEFDTAADAQFYYGADWGFSVDPTVMARLYINGRNLYIDREVYKIGVEIDHIPAFFDTLDNQQAREWRSIADSARPETISYLQRHGYPHMQAAIKGKDSVKEGVIFLQGYDIVVHPRCRHTIDELKSYSFVKDRLTGAITPVLEDKKNHVIDSLRYAVEPIRRPKEFLSWA